MSFLLRIATLLAAFIIDLVRGDSGVYTLHSDSTCSSIPTLIAFQEQALASCTAITTCASVNIHDELVYWNRACVSETYTTFSKAAFKSKPFVVMEIYKSGTQCTNLLSGIAFIADDSCIVSDNGASSIKVALLSDGSATFSTYRGVNCTSPSVKTRTVKNSSISSHFCENGALKFYSSDAATSAAPNESNPTISTTTSHSTPGLYHPSIIFQATAALILYYYAS